MKSRRGNGTTLTNVGRTRLLWFARVVTEIFAPAPITAALLLAIAVHSSPTIAAGLTWGLLSMVFASVVPLLYVLRGVQRRKLSDRHVRQRTQRPLPLLFGIASVVVGLALLALLGAPRELVALVAAMTVGLTASLLVTLVWKISVHTAVVAGAVVILALTFGPIWLVLAAVVILVGWSRVELSDHTAAQVSAGAALGAVVAALVFTLIR